MITNNHSYWWLVLFSIFFAYTPLFSQVPDESWKLYDDSQVAKVEITMSPADLQWMYANTDSDSCHVAKIHFKNKYIDETLDSVGIRLRGATSRDAKKKSFKISFNEFLKGSRFYAVKDLNFNGEHNDPSIIRSKLCFDHFSRIRFKAARASHAELYINGTYYGLYVSVEGIDDTFLKRNFSDDSGNLWKCLYPADLKFLGSDPSIYKNLLNSGVPAYELKTNEAAGDFTGLVHLIDIVNNTSDTVFPDSLEANICINEVLEYLALNVLFGSWDSYWSLKNNYYLYNQPSTGKFHIIPYDYDNSYGVSMWNIPWATTAFYAWPKVESGNRPLADRMMANAQYRNLYTHFLEFYRDHTFNLSLWESRLDSLKALIRPSAVNDTYRTQDYGFTIAQFDNSYTAGSFSYLHVKNGIKQYVNLRNNSIATQIEYLFANPIVYNISVSPERPAATDTITVAISAFDNSGLSETSMMLSINNGSMQTIPMVFSPIAGTNRVEDADRYIAKISPLGSKGIASISFKVKDNQAQSQIYPRKGPFTISASPAPVSKLVINEFLADNTSYPDPSGDFDDFVEIYNPTDSIIKLTGMYLTDTPGNLKKWRFSKDSLSIHPKEFVVVWCDEQTTQPGLHANFKLSKSGEYIALTDTDGVTVFDSLSFGVQTTNISYGRYPDAGKWGFMSPTPGMKNSPVSVSDKPVGKSFSLEQNYPNPFNPVTKIRYELPVSGMIQLRIFDVLGREIQSLVNQFQPAGKYTVNFNGERLASGIYYYSLNAGGQITTRKMVLIK
ncbi:MAG: CotH kinase family protein [Ignavibacteria bacterium]|nr:CotH kinase family protein [Ignavibacteria bacterium]